MSKSQLVNKIEDEIAYSCDVKSLKTRTGQPLSPHNLADDIARAVIKHFQAHNENVQL